ncbi:carbohydrate-binding module family 13 protein [Laccaria amethystina LaAM-08-1]|uniref:Carbohydrate-binding module family 13 protein n=1 Tax=Laccaria amethystina LaAM-08-1 TaxID=1095629 RepID=A0A0C9X7L4_9AGAR|nr:carbohydrate-binding module family 13 protein [Laccaria amethystina LaAM-08-1]
MAFYLSFILLAFSSIALANLQFTINNKCPQPIMLYINGESQGSLAFNGIVSKIYSNDWSGFIYTNLNAGSGNTGVGTTRAGFYGNASYYYIVRDLNNFNTGVSIAPTSPISNGFCDVDVCNNATCTNVYNSPPTQFPAPSIVAPSVPLYQCPGSTGYTVTFCPADMFPVPKDAVGLHPIRSANKCLDVRGGIFQNGTAVQIYDCNETAAQKWIIGRGATTPVLLAGTGFCLDAGKTPASGVGLKIWQCFAGLPAQTWIYTLAGSIVLNGTNQCVDLTDGLTDNGNRLQTYQCADGNVNQAWTT